MTTCCIMLALFLGGDATRQEQYTQIAAEFDTAREKAIQASRAAKTEAEERAIAWPRPKSFAPRLMTLVEANPEDEPARKAMIWLMEHNVDLGFNGATRPMAARSVDFLLKFHKGDDSLGVLALKLSDYPTPPRDRFLQTLHEQTNNRANRGRACLALAQHLKMKGEYAQKLQMPAFPAEDLANEVRYHGAAYLAALKDADPAPLLAESKRLYERVIAEYPKIDYLPSHRNPDRPRTLAEVAASDLDEMLRLAVGKTAPEIEGQDIDGRPMRLSDYRGKVVVLVFWGSWCGPCMAKVPYERALVERMRDRPFALVGVNSDEDCAKLKETIQREKITWRSWFDDGRVGGPIVRRWNVTGWPTVYILDHKGTIRVRQADGAAFIDKVVDDLVQEADRDTADRPRIR